MQLLLSFAEQREPESEPSIWLMLPAEQREQATAVLARLLAKAAAVNAERQNNEEQNDE